MAAPEMPLLQKIAGATAHLDAPQPGTAVYGESISISGWCHFAGRDPAQCCVHAWVDGALIGQTRALFVRPDVSAAVGLAENIPTGFRILGFMPAAGMEPRAAMLTLSASWRDDPVEYEVVRAAVRLIPALLATRPYGDVVNPQRETLLHREDIYGSGPPLEQPSALMLSLMRDYLPARCSVLDVGCGAGAYGAPLRHAGHEWLGLEIDSRCLEILERRQLPYRRVSAEAKSLPSENGEWDAAVCIEVLEHISEPHAFLAEVTRSIRHRALFSVPNLEVIPYFSGLDVVPWHLLEADHKNFFTRASLRSLLERHFRHVEVFSCAEHPLRSREEIPLHVHLFAIADK